MRDASEMPESQLLSPEKFEAISSATISLGNHSTYTTSQQHNLSFRKERISSHVLSEECLITFRLFIDDEVNVTFVLQARGKYFGLPGAFAGGPVYPTMRVRAN